MCVYLSPLWGCVYEYERKRESVCEREMNLVNASFKTPETRWLVWEVRLAEWKSNVWKNQFVSLESWKDCGIFILVNKIF